MCLVKPKSCAFIIFNLFRNCIVLDKNHPPPSFIFSSSQNINISFFFFKIYAIFWYCLKKYEIQKRKKLCGNKESNAGLIKRARLVFSERTQIAITPLLSTLSHHKMPCLPFFNTNSFSVLSSSLSST